MRLHDLKPADGSKHRRKRIGRGPGSGRGGHTSTRGQKGQGSRSGSSTRPGFEGGQLPLARRLPKRGFNNKKFATLYIPVNLESLNQFDDGATVDEAALRAAGLVNGRGDGVKILGQGELEKKLTVKAAAFSASARAAIEGKGGSCEVAAKAEAKASE
ncbi:MAG: 50S ribosomal protein L15 [Verrucomicrobiota bacterium]|jgi:large subunit ribosomal protein L15|nr:50S ribosomal protein L15 [Verrucomicrobiales bacterium]MED5278008.1 50S ribosomal protein L15 [Verrucomicrobiota bacterium]HBV31634.1 50S ribosomal protein L15 [Verrucomicrobiales bacterium]|tara:strand:- start:205 stop:678 length:474 start_codon:yes stop_codon:yes gene_type:complete